MTGQSQSGLTTELDMELEILDTMSFVSINTDARYHTTCHELTRRDGSTLFIFEQPDPTSDDGRTDVIALDEHALMDLYRALHNRFGV